MYHNLPSKIIKKLTWEQVIFSEKQKELSLSKVRNWIISIVILIIGFHALFIIKLEWPLPLSFLEALQSIRWIMGQTFKQLQEQWIQEYLQPTYFIWLGVVLLFFFNALKQIFNWSWILPEYNHIIATTEKLHIFKLTNTEAYARENFKSCQIQEERWKQKLILNFTNSSLQAIGKNMPQIENIINKFGWTEKIQWFLWKFMLFPRSLIFSKLKQNSQVNNFITKNITPFLEIKDFPVQELYPIANTQIERHK